ncbi:MAG: 50S ribosomal protein L21 [Microgenomates group bacterium GW2011_GWC1_43_11]|uniref:Large ribosomal subunit protein bL21 n=2 Tax=Candidatus Gottesmaniibacteriota TaxID=1752720 RepID=A0A0G1LM15_9BACT|nr:MAG: 50S ribosomal protein L21 [Microgenomates group bacterium GW2011_GWC1_43_11]KKT36990.1 MAG: 50S ribosomal protein L21 [Candidatus Gottesmanbacteria bacterium GW2011_GWB1_44_11c]KKT60904.1 MAG: 50S ribosomal protein L21 [Candidatus Gottesmanbacteria bacterium GW2011_GWA1_44_24b]HCM82504.1 50S ribosomal protein L21 [Patescibacteria group bacterium]
MFAIIQYAGKQFIVSPGERITVPHAEGNVGDTFTIHDVLLVSDPEKTSIGTPLVKGTVAEVKIVSQKKGKKLTVRRFKSKVRYRKTRGFREQLTDIEILKIG